MIFSDLSIATKYEVQEVFEYIGRPVSENEALRIVKILGGEIPEGKTYYAVSSRVFIEYIKDRQDLESVVEAYKIEDADEFYARVFSWHLDCKIEGTYNKYFPHLPTEFDDGTKRGYEEEGNDYLD